MSKRTNSAAATGLPKFDRAKLERAIERLILLLDLSDPDPDLEDDPDMRREGNEYEDLEPEWFA